jgi:crotonobetainyl-CoA:carnitine CoA-transferase CaiB-like acyl-CoA transferase
MTMAGALEGVRVVDVSTIVQGPQATAMLHDLGAEVIKVELPGLGDGARWVWPLPERHSAVFVACNRGKRSVTTDLRTPGGKRILKRLVEGADVLVSNFQPGTLERWDLGYEVLSEVNPRLIWAAASYLGPDGPDAAREGADMVGQASGGVIATSGADGGPMYPVGVLIADHCGSQNLATAVLAALYARERTGRGQQVHASLLGGQIWAQATEYTHYLLSGQLTGRSNGSHPLVNAFYGIYTTADGYIAIAGCPEHLWPGMCRAVERPDLLDHPRFGRLLTTPEVKVELREVFDAIFAQRTTAEWSERLAAEGQRFAPVRDHREVAEDPQVYANDYLVEVEHPEWGPIRVVGSPISMSATPTRWGVVAPELGQHTEEVLLEAGFEWPEIEAFRDEGAI